MNGFLLIFAQCYTCAATVWIWASISIITAASVSAVLREAREVEICVECCMVGLTRVLGFANTRVSKRESNRGSQWVSGRARGWGVNKHGKITEHGGQWFDGFSARLRPVRASASSVSLSA
jgi:hypothetical protein